MTPRHRFAAIATRTRAARAPARTLLALLASVLCCSAHAQVARIDARAEQQSFDRIVDAVVARYHLPGIAVGVIEDGKHRLHRTRANASPAPGRRSTPNTLFKIASNSKAMTTALLGRLVDQGKLRWDDPVTKYLPDFAMHDPWVTKHMRVADLLTHSSGLPEGGGDLMLWPEPNAFTRADIIHGLRYIKPGYSFRSQYQYDNLLYVVAGEVAAAAGGAPYETLMRREVFAAARACRAARSARGTAMRSATWPSRTAAAHGRNVADARGRSRRSPRSPRRPAGGIRCDLTDMLTWARNWLAPTPAQLAWLSAEQRQVLQAPHMLIPVSAQRRAWDHSHVMAYGYGWRMADVDGHWNGVAHRHAGRHVFDAVAAAGPRRRLRVHDQRRGRGCPHRAGRSADSSTSPHRTMRATWPGTPTRWRMRREPAPARSAAPGQLEGQRRAPAAATAWTGRYRDPVAGRGHPVPAPWPCAVRRQQSRPGCPAR